MNWNNIFKARSFLEENKIKVYISACLVSCGIILFIINNSSYKAEAKVLVIPKTSQNKVSDEMQTQFEQLSNKDLLINTIYYLKLTKKNGDSMTPEDFKNNLNVSQIKKTKVLQVSFRYNNATEAKAALSHLLNTSILTSQGESRKDLENKPVDILKEKIQNCLAQKTKLLQNKVKNKQKLIEVRNKINDLTIKRNRLLLTKSENRSQSELREPSLKIIEPVHGSNIPDYPYFILGILILTSTYSLFKLKGLYFFKSIEWIRFSTKSTRPSHYLTTVEISALTPFPLLGIVPDIILPDIFTTSGVTSLLKILEYFENNPQFIDLLNKKMVNILITNYGTSEFKTRVSTAIATSMALSGKKVAVVSLTKNGDIQHYLGVKTEKGLTDFLLGESLNNIQTQTDIQNMVYIDRGTVELSLTDILKHNRMFLLHSQLKVYFDVVIFDVEPLFDIPNLGDFCPYVDASLILISSKELEYSKMVQAYNLLKESSLPITGVIINTDETLS